jgi:hypothetical protein
MGFIVSRLLGLTILIAVVIELGKDLLVTCKSPWLKVCLNRLKQKSKRWVPKIADY